MATKKRAAGKTGNKGRRTRTAAADDGVGHSPIIITDGSGSVEFSKTEYKHLGSGNHTSKGLHLDNVEARTNPNAPHPHHICHEFQGSDLHQIEVACILSGKRSDITIEGRKSGSNRSPKIKFKRGTDYKETGFPPKHVGKGRRFGNKDAKIISFRIINLTTGQVLHDCPLVQSGGFEFTVNDGHD